MKRIFCLIASAALALSAAVQLHAAASAGDPPCG